MRYVDVLDKAKLRLESLDLSLFWYIDAEDRLYMSANPFMREVGKVEFKKAAAICRTSPIQTRFSYMLIGDHQIDLMCVEEEEDIDAVLDYMLDDRGWWKKKQSVKADVMKLREVLRSALASGVLGVEEPEEPEEAEEPESVQETQEESKDASAPSEAETTPPPGGEASSKATFLTGSLIDKLNKAAGNREPS